MGQPTTALLHLGLAACLAGAASACGGGSGGPRDTTPPAVLSTAPADGATGVQPQGLAVSATFSEAMDPATLDASTFFLEAGGGPLPGAVGYGAGSATFWPSQLDWATTYRATVTTGARDLAGNALAAAVSWTFTTAPAPDLTLPEVVAREPADGAAAVSPDASVVVTFSEPVEASSAVAGISLSGPAGPVAASVSVLGATATLAPAARLDWATTYGVLVGTAVADLAGNHLLAPVSWSFTTAPAPDTTPPSVTSAYPPDGAAGVDPGVYVTASFSEGMVPATLDASTFQVRGPGGAPVAGTVEAGGYPSASVVTFTPAAPLAPGTAYTIAATAGATDLAGNPLVPYSSSFTTTGAGTGSWTPMAAPDPLGTLAARAGPSAVWTGSRMIVWGGWYLGPAPTYLIHVLANGGRYSTATDTWESIPSNLPGTPFGRFRHATIWTGSRMIVWGGAVVGSNGTQTGGIYDPAPGAAGGWTATSTLGAPEGRSDPVAVWTGTEMVVWGGWDPTGFDAYQGSGGRYAPGTDTWAATSLAGAPSPRVYPAAVWTGARMLVWGGLGVAGALGDGAAYDPAGDTWTPMASGPSARYQAAAVWTGSRMIVWGGVGAGGYLSDGAAYDPGNDTWSALPAVDLPPREEPAAVWTGSRMMVWGGAGANPAFTRTGGAYDPQSGSWTLTALAGAPSPRRQPAAVWTGSELLVWGGWGDAGILEDGARWAP